MTLLRYLDTCPGFFCLSQQVINIDFLEKTIHGSFVDFFGECTLFIEFENIEIVFNEFVDGSLLVISITCIPVFSKSCLYFKICLTVADLLTVDVKNKTVVMVFFYVFIVPGYLWKDWIRTVDRFGQFTISKHGDVVLYKLYKKFADIHGTERPGSIIAHQTVDADVKVLGDVVKLLQGKKFAVNSIDGFVEVGLQGQKAHEPTWHVGFNI